MIPPEEDSPSFISPLRFEGLSAFGLFVICMVVLVPSIGDYGVTWDEASPNFPAARQQVSWFQRFLTTGEGLNEAGVREGFETESDHPSLPRTLMALSRLALGEGVSDRVAFALPISISVSVFFAVFFFVTKRQLGWTAGLGGTALLLLHPRWFAHSHLAEYDVLIAVTWWSAAMSFYWANDPRQGAGTGWGRAVAAAFLTGLALSVKLHAFFLPFPFLIWVLVFRRWGAWKWAVASAVACPLLYLGTQPYLWWNTVERLSKRFLDYSEKLPIRVYYLGDLYGGDLPWHYAWLMLVATLPVGFFFFALLGGFRLFSSDREPAAVKESVLAVQKPFGDLQTQRIAFLILNAMTTPLIFTWKSPYDGIRLFLTAVPFLAMLAAEGIVFLQSLATGRWAAGPAGWFRCWSLRRLRGKRTPVSAFTPTGSRTTQVLWVGSAAPTASVSKPPIGVRESLLRS